MAGLIAVAEIVWRSVGNEWAQLNWMPLKLYICMDQFLQRIEFLIDGEELGPSTVPHTRVQQISTQHQCMHLGQSGAVFYKSFLEQVVTSIDLSREEASFELHLFINYRTVSPAIQRRDKPWPKHNGRARNKNTMWLKAMSREWIIILLGCLREQAKWPTGASIRLPLKFCIFTKRLFYEKLSF